MKIIKSKNMGLCFGVKRALKKADSVINEVKNDDIYMLGEIIHNPQVIQEYKKRGVKIVQEVTQVPSDKYLITRAHGISLYEMEIAKQNNIKLIDTTCPYVKKLHNIMLFLQNDNYQIVIFGDSNHPEIRSLLSYANTNTVIIQSVSEIKNCLLDNKDKVALVSQTTKNANDFKEIINNIIDKVEELRIFNTICKSTTLRQIATSELADSVDVMIVVGGLNSANTIRLAEISKRIGVDTYHIEDDSEIKEEWFKCKQKIGITSGASTPDYITKSVINKIKKIMD